MTHRTRKHRPATGVFLFCLAFAALTAACSDRNVGSSGIAENPIDDLPIDSEVAVAGLDAPVDIVTDDHGVKHIYGPDAATVLFAQGYVTAQQRFFSMDVIRKFATGRLSELFGSFTVGMDVEMRTVFTTRDGRRLEDALLERLAAEFPDGLRLLEAYSGGINAWIDDLRAGRNGATLPPEYGFAIIAQTAAAIDAWRPADTLAVGRLQAYTLSGTLFSDLGRARQQQALPAALHADLFRLAPAAPTTVLGNPPAATTAASSEGASSDEGSGRTQPAAVARAILDAVLAAHARTAALNPLGTRSEGAAGVGSNNWIVAPSMSASGHAMMANDPHLALYNPPIWHMVQLSAEGQGPGADDHLSVNGVIFPGLPGVILGHNDYGAWGGTVSGWDVTDVYVEQVTTPSDYPASPRTVSYRGQQVPVLRVDERFEVNFQEPRTYVVEIVPHHGPMVPDPDLDDEQVGLAATGMSFRWTGHEISLDSRFLLGLGRARSAAEFREALLDFAVGGQNWVWADVNGDVTYFPYVLVPRRPAGVIPWMPLPGDGSADWLTDAAGNTQWLSPDEIPQATNPSEGFVATANNDQNGNTLDNDPLNDGAYLGEDYDLGFRAQRIREMLTNSAGLRRPGAKISVADMARYQYEHQSKEAERFLPYLFAAAEAHPDLVTPAMADAIARLRAWGEGRPGREPGAVAYDMVSGVDLADVREDVPPRSTPVSDEERTDAAATTIFVGWLSRLPRLALADDLDGTGVGVPGGQDATKALLHLLENTSRTDALRVHTLGANGESTVWDDSRTAEVETRDTILLRALDQGVAFLAESFATSDQSGWLWGSIHRARFQHFFGQGGLPIFDTYPFPAPGGRFTVNPGGHGLGDDWDFAGGPSMRFVVDLDPAGIRAINILPGGNGGNPGGTDNENFNRINPALDYGTHIPGWINGDVIELRITRQEVANHARSRIRLVP